MRASKVVRRAVQCAAGDRFAAGSKQTSKALKCDFAGTDGHVTNVHLLQRNAIIIASVQPDVAAAARCEIGLDRDLPPMAVTNSNAMIRKRRFYGVMSTAAAAGRSAISYTRRSGRCPVN